MPKAEQSLNGLLHEIRRIEQSREVLTEKKIRSIYKQLLKELNHFLADEYLKYSQNGILTVTILQEKSRYAKFLEEIEANVNNLTPEIMALIRKTVEDTYIACYKGMSDAVLNSKDTKFALEYLRGLNVRPDVMKRAIENPVSGLTLPDILEKNRKEVIYDINQQVNISLMNGDRYETTAKKIAEKLDFSYGKATNIVRTETHRVTESGFMDCAKGISEALEDSEFVYAAIWHNMNDERVRPQQRYHTKSGWKTSTSRNGANHQKMEGKIIHVGDKFQLEPNVYAECPGMSGTARNDCRCRCFLEYDLMTKDEFIKRGGKLLDNSGKSGIIEIGSDKVALENQRYGRNKDTLVNKTYIESGKYRRKFDNATDNPKVNKALYDCSKKALKHRSGTALEDMYWIDSNTGKTILSVIDSTDERAIIYTDKIKNIIKNSKNIVTIHTHPSSMPPSIDDFNSCFKNGYDMGFVACHNGKVFKYSSNQEIRKELYNLYVNSYINEGLSEFNAQFQALNKLKENHEIDFMEVV